MSRPRSVGLFMSYLCDLFFFFIFISIMINLYNLMNTETHVLLLIFRVCPIILDDTVDEECE